MMNKIIIFIAVLALILSIFAVRQNDSGGDTAPAGNTAGGDKLVKDRNVGYAAFTVASGSDSATIDHTLQGTPTMVITLDNSFAGFQYWNGYNENHGSITFNSGSTTYTVTHGVTGGTPNYMDATPNIYTGTLSYAVGTPTSTTFVIVRTGTAPADVTVYWQAYSDDAPTVPISSVGTDTFVISRPAGSTGAINGYYITGS